MKLAKKMLLEETCEYCQYYKFYECVYWADKALEKIIEGDDEFADISYEDNVEKTTPNSYCEKFKRGDYNG